MSNPFVAEIRIFAGNFAPRGWAFCNGQLLPISQNTALFSLLGTFYGGDGKSTFALPDLQGSAPIHQGQGAGLSEHFLGEQGGTQFVTLLDTELPAHSHQAQANPGGNKKTSPVANTWSSLGTTRTPPPLYSNTQNTQMSPLALSVSGGSLPHNNMPPYLCLTFIIALQGVFPARN
jgi:microcystin-dependent protein